MPKLSQSPCHFTSSSTFSSPRSPRWSTWLADPGSWCYLQTNTDQMILQRQTINTSSLYLLDSLTHSVLQPGLQHWIMSVWSFETATEALWQVTHIPSLTLPPWMHICLRVTPLSIPKCKFFVTHLRAICELWACEMTSNGALLFFSLLAPVPLCHSAHIFLISSSSKFESNHKLLHLERGTEGGMPRNALSDCNARLQVWFLSIRGNVYVWAWWWCCRFLSHRVGETN